jgi:hypothetical protein
MQPELSNKSNVAILISRVTGIARHWRRQSVVELSLALLSWSLLRPAFVPSYRNSSFARLNALPPSQALWGIVVGA